MKKEKDPSKQVFKSLVNMLTEIEGNFNDEFKKALISGDMQKTSLLVHETAHHFKVKHGKRLSESDLEKISRVCVESERQWAFVVVAEHDKTGRIQAMANSHWNGRFQVNTSKLPSDVAWVAEGKGIIAGFNAHDLFLEILKKNFYEKLPRVQFNENASPNQANVSTANPQSSAVPQTPAPSKSSTEGPAKVQQSASPQPTAGGSDKPTPVQSHQAKSAPNQQWVKSDEKALIEAAGYLRTIRKLMDRPDKNSDKNQKVLTNITKKIDEKLKALEGKDDRNSEALKRVYEKSRNLISKQSTYKGPSV
ncbi:MAG: hypothetical protein K2X50_09505 [Gammaproteobacteria bacterium]|nr:hypothetical protein [Gammaproteobacteria bacterium]